MGDAEADRSRDSTDAEGGYLIDQTKSAEVRRSGRATDGSDPMEQLRALFEQRAPDGRPETTSGPDRRLLWGILLVSTALLLSGVLSGAAPDTPAKGSQAVDPTGEPETLYLARDDAAYLNRVFRETSHEVGYCGIITTEAGRPWLSVWMADTVSSGPGQMQYQTDNCPEATREVLVHTHPNGGPGLSETDRATLYSRHEEYMCVQAGTLRTQPGTHLDDLVCVKQVPTGDPAAPVRRIPVRIAERSTGGG